MHLVHKEKTETCRKQGLGTRHTIGLRGRMWGGRLNHKLVKKNNGRAPLVKRRANMC